MTPRLARRRATACGSEQAEDLRALWFREESPDPACRWLPVNALVGISVQSDRIVIRGEVVPLKWGA